MVDIMHLYLQQKQQCRIWIFIEFKSRKEAGYTMVFFGDDN